MSSSKIVSFSYPEVVEVGVEVELYANDDGDSSAMITAFNGGHALPVPLDADQADELAAAVADVARQLHALEVQQ